MTVRVAINGFGRIGRNILRSIIESGRKDILVVGINDLGPVETNAHLLRYDSVHGKFPSSVKVDGSNIDVGNGPIKVTSIRDPKELPWKDLDVDIAMECTGIFTSKEKASMHLEAGAKRVLVSAPTNGADLTVVYGVNHNKLTNEHLVVSNASCTTNCLAPIAMALNNGVGITQGFMTTIHSYTGDLHFHLVQHLIYQLTLLLGQSIYKTLIPFVVFPFSFQHEQIDFCEQELHFPVLT